MHKTYAVSSSHYYVSGLNRGIMLPLNALKYTSLTAASEFYITTLDTSYFEIETSMTLLNSAP